MKTRRIMALALCVVLLVSALSVPTAAQAQEKVLRIIHNVFEQTWSPLSGGNPRIRLNSLWFAAPMYYDAKSEIVPQVFVKWEANPDFTVWTFKIDPKATFSDGSKITAAEVAAGWNLMGRPATKHQRIDLFLSSVLGYEKVIAGEAKDFEGLKVVDDETLEATLKAPDPIFAKRLATHLLPVIKATTAQDADGNELPEWWHPKNSPVVSGPFMPESMDLDKGELVFVRNPNFFGPKPKLDKITIRTVEDVETTTLLLRERQADAHTHFEGLVNVKDLPAEFTAGPIIPKGHHFWFSASVEPTSDINVRKALIMALDLDQMFKVAFPDGPNMKADMILNAVAGADDPAYEPYKYDPDGAKAALAASKYGSAVNLPKLRIVGVSRPPIQLAAQYMAEQWRQVLGIEQVEFKPQFDDYTGPDQALITIFRDDVGTRVPDAVAYLQGSIYSKSGNAQSKMGGYLNPAVDKLIEEAAVLGVDNPDRVKKAQEAQRLFRDDYMFIPWYHETQFGSAMPWVTGLAKNLDWQIIEPWNVDIVSQ